jgi:UDP-N-acetylglucosamine transferase subunit ALG13
VILVTVGTWKFDGLVKAVDHLIEKGVIREETFAQIGNGDYVPANCPHARFLVNFQDYLRKADTVISHGGSTVLEAVSLGKRLIAVANPEVADQHQLHFLEGLHRVGHIVWCRDLGDLEACLLDDKPVRPYHSRCAELTADILRFFGVEPPAARPNREGGGCP